MKSGRHGLCSCFFHDYFIENSRDINFKNFDEKTPAQASGRRGQRVFESGYFKAAAPFFLFFSPKSAILEKN